MAMLRLPSARVSDHWKARVSRRYAANAFRSAIALFILIFVSLTPIFAVMWLIAGSLNGMQELAVRPWVTIVVAFVAAGYLLLRTWIRARV